MIDKETTYALLQLLNKDPRPTLFGFRSPGCVRAAALLGIEDRADDDFLVRHANKDILRYPELITLLETWGNDGHWGISRLQMKAMGLKKAEKIAIRTAIQHLMQLQLYQYDLSRNTRRLKTLISFCTPSVFAPAILHNRLSVQASALTLVLSQAQLFSLIPDEYRKMLEQWLSQVEQGEDTANPISWENPQRSISACHLGLAGLQAAGIDSSQTALQLLQWIAETGDQFREEWSRMMMPSIRFSWKSCLELAVIANLTTTDPLVKPWVDAVIAEQQDNSLWQSDRKDPLPDENLFLTLDIVLLLKQLVKNTLDDESATDSEKPKD